MKRSLSIIATFLSLHVLAIADTTISDAAPYSWGANIGWIDWRADGLNGAVLDPPPIASGYIYSANIGWIHLGDGTPTNGVQHGNESGDDYGVNLDLVSQPGYALLSGYAYSANAGWIVFDSSDPATRPKLDRNTGQLSGYAYGANIGWLPLDSGSGVVTTLEPFQFTGFMAY